MNGPIIRRALLSVADKTNLETLAKSLHARGIEILSTGGTADFLKKHGIPVTAVSQVTDFPEIMRGRVKTLHPKIHAALLARPKHDDAILAQHDIARIDLLIVNLYPFGEVVREPNCSFMDAIEHIDIGGPAMLRSAAKNYEAVTVVVDPQDYAAVNKQITAQQSVDQQSRFRLAKKVFAHTALYDANIANYLGALNENDHKPNCFPDTYSVQFSKKMDLRYGENPHQNAAFYVERTMTSGNIAHSKVLQGKPLSYNNIVDSDAALECIKEFSVKEACCVIVKHANPCGVAIAENLTLAYQRTFATDPNASFGGIIAFNQTLDANTAKAIIEQQFVEIIIAPVISKEAQTILAAKPNVRVLACGHWQQYAESALDYKRINGGLLVQERDTQTLNRAQLKTVTTRQATPEELKDALFAWHIAKHVKSNAIVYAKNQATIGVGAGQMSRVYSARIAAIKARDENLSIEHAVMASDAFFPFRDTIDEAAKLGIAIVIQPGGSIRDEEIIQAANEANMVMLFTGIRHFRH